MLLPEPEYHLMILTDPLLTGRANFLPVLSQFLPSLFTTFVTEGTRPFGSTTNVFDLKRLTQILRS